MAYSDVFDNHLYERNYFDNEIHLSLPPVRNPDEIFARLAAVRKNIIKGDSEAGLDISFTKSLLEILGWPCAYQQHFALQGIKKIPDFLLFANERDQARFLGAPRDAKPLGLILSVWEDKAVDVPLDNGKTGQDNPYFQLVGYLDSLRLPFGFLGNGHELLYVDTSEHFREKRFLKVNFERLVQSRDPVALRIFMGIFGHQGHVEDPEKNTPAVTAAQASIKYREQSEAELADTIYGLNGRESMFEKIGTLLFAAQKTADPAILSELYKNCLYLTFRLIFIAFFEDRHRDILQKHPGYRSISLTAIRSQAAEELANGNANGYQAWDALQKLFQTLDEGNPNLDIPLFNGGLFSRKIAAMLNQAKVMTNGEVMELLNMLYGAGADGYLRDFAALSTIQLGRIYESLLEYEFRIAEENLWYFEYKTRQKGKPETVDGFFDTEDYKNITGSKKHEITQKPREYKKGEVYLVGGKNSRKRSASYYTPQSLAAPLVTSALDDCLAKLGESDSLLDLRILDNACGSGHLLVEALQYLTRLALRRLDSDPRLRDVLDEEKRRIMQALEDMDVAKYGIEVDELAVLKRILLKKTLYGVDLQPFAVELARLSLWIETFVFGTPLSFIEHHIKAGNSLVGSSAASIRKILPQEQGTLVEDALAASMRRLETIHRKLNDLQDTTAADIAASKQIYGSEIKPALEELNGYFNLLNAIHLLLAESAAEKKLAADRSLAEPERKSLLLSAASKKAEGSGLLARYKFHVNDLLRHEASKHLDALLQMQRLYECFNWETEFPEAFTTPADCGFHVIIGNPPWDKIKFTEPDFFSHYRSNYRQLPNSAKKAIARDLLAKPFIRKRYEKQRNEIMAINEYYREHFPYSQGGGDANIFRFFVEKNLRLLRKGGTLNYVIPTALWTDDGSSDLRRHIFNKFWLKSFYGFENRNGLFPDIDSRYKFGLMQIEKPTAPMQPDARVTEARFMLISPAELEDRSKNISYSHEDIRITSPRWDALMELRSSDELKIMRKLHGRGFEYLSPDWLDFRRELDATNDKKIFQEEYKEGMIPLYQGACIWQYDSEYWLRAGEDNKNRYWLDPAEFGAYLLAKERGRLVDDVYAQLNTDNTTQSKLKTVLRALNLLAARDLDQFLVPDSAFPRLAFRAIASDTNERTMIAAMIPANVGAQNSLWTSIPKRYRLNRKKVIAEPADLLRFFFAQAFFNSLVFDWVMRSSIAINVNKTYIWRMPMPQPDRQEILANADYLALARNSLALSAYYNEKAFLPLFADLGIAQSDKINSLKAVNMGRREIDLIVARLYGLAKADMEVMLSSFKVMNASQPGYGCALLERM